MNHKAARGLAYVHTWAPDKLPKTDPAPAFTLHKPAGDVGPLDMAPIRASASVTAISADQRTLTLSGALAGGTGPGPGPGPGGVFGPRSGEAWLDLGEAGRWPVRVLTSDGATVELAAPLPHDVPTDATGSLYWNLWEVSLSAAQVGSDTLKRVRWTIEWTEDRGADRTAIARRSRGLLDIVPQPFDTGLTDAGVLAAVPILAVLVPPEQVSYAPQRALAEQVLVGWLRRGLPDGYTEDDVNGPQFEAVHALLTAAMVLRAHQVAGYDRDPGELEGEAKHLLNAALLDLDWLDDGDGEVDSGETGVNAAGVSPAAIYARSHMTPSSGAKPTIWPPEDLTRKSVTEAL